MIKKQVKYKGKVVFEKVILSRFERLPKVNIDDEACVMFLDGGEFTLRSSSQILKINHKSALISKCMNYFFELPSDEEFKEEIVEAIGVMLHPSIITDLFDLPLLQSSISASNQQSLCNIDPLLQAFKDSISHLIEHPQLADEKMVEIKLRELVFLVMRQQEASITEFFSNLFDPIIYELEQTIQNNLFANLSIDELAFLTHMSTSTFKRRFKEIYKQSPHKYIISKKIEKACSLLKSTNFLMSDICDQCGFDGISTFNRNFQKIVGMSPSEYRLH